VLAFFLIGFDLSMRDWLQVRLKAWHMGVLIGVSGTLTYALNPAAGMIAVASSVAFTSAALVDWATFTRLKGSWLFRSNGSNVVGAAVDSLIFPTIAFGMLMPSIVAMQFVAKVVGGSIWAALLSRNKQRTAQTRLGVALKILLWFAHDPDDKLTTSELAEMFGSPRNNVACALRYARMNGLLESKRTTKKFGMGQQMLWTAGPKMREIIGEVS
jgi:hypothetical protein